MSEIDKLRKQLRALRNTGRLTPFIADLSSTDMDDVIAKINTILDQLKQAGIVGK